MGAVRGHLTIFRANQTSKGSKKRKDQANLKLRGDDLQIRSKVKNQIKGLGAGEWPLNPPPDHLREILKTDQMSGNSPGLSRHAAPLITRTSRKTVERRVLARGEGTNKGGGRARRNRPAQEDLDD